MRTLLIDTCADVGSVALAQGLEVAAFVEMEARSASASIVESIRSALKIAGWSRQDLQGVGVVNGPGSFTGVRVGLACAKGLCEALGLPIAVVSRLQVLASIADLQTGYALLSAGRDEVYVLDVEQDSESLQPLKVWREERMASLAFGERSLAANIGRPESKIFQINAASAVACVLRRLKNSPDRLESVDANYVRGEQQIYRSPSRLQAVPS